MSADQPGGDPIARRSRTVSGEIVLPDTGVPAEASAVVVRVEDISRADAPSKVVGEQRIDHAILAGRRVIPFSVDVPTNLVDQRGLYSIQAHIDVNGSGEVEAGDLVSTQTHPTLTRGAGDVTVVPVKKV